VVVEDGLAYDYLSIEDNRKVLENIISNLVGREVAVTIQNVAVGSNFEDSYVDLSKIINMDVIIEDEEEN
jgi:DNA polymerase-3 subunit gamma/tau